MKSATLNDEVEQGDRRVRFWEAVERVAMAGWIISALWLVVTVTIWFSQMHHR